MWSIYKKLATRLREREDGEHEQGLMRLLFVVVVGLTFYAADRFDWVDQGTEAVVWACIIYFAVGIAILAVILWRPAPSPARRLFAIVGDNTAISTMIAVAGGPGEMLYPIYLWLVIGNGFRYGQKYLFVAMAASVIGFGLAVANSSYWLSQPLAVAGLSVGLVALPLYFVVLLQRLQRATNELNTLYEQMAAQATHDNLTGLPNRKLFYDQLRHEIDAARRRQTGLAVMFIDIDGFKQINDTHGHPVGDDVIRIVGHALNSGVRSTDSVARFGGDEFLVLVTDVNVAQAGIVAQKLLDKLTTLRIPHHDDIRLSGSIGIAVLSTAADNPDSMIRQADVAMYRAKKSGKNAYRLYTD